MPSTDIIRTKIAVQYNGSNVSEMLALTGGMLFSNVGGVLTIMDGSGTMVTCVMSPGDWWEIDYGYWSQTDFNNNHITKAAALLDTNTVFDPTGLQSQITANANAITALQTGKLGKADIFSISVPILILGGTVDRVVTWNRAFTNANYDLSYAFDVNTVGRITCAPVAGTKTTTGVTIRISAGLAVTVLGVVHVFGVGV